MKKEMQRLCVRLLWLLAAYISLPTVGFSREEISYFRLTDFNAFLNTRNEYTENRNKTSDAETVVESPHLNKQLGVSTRSYIYHPNMLQLELSGTVSLDELDSTRKQTTLAGKFKSESSSTVGFWGLDARLNFLQNKPYPVTLFYSRTNPLVSTGLEGGFTSTERSLFSTCSGSAICCGVTSGRTSLTAGRSHPS